MQTNCCKNSTCKKCGSFNVSNYQAAHKCHEMVTKHTHQMIEHMAKLPNGGNW